MNLWFFNKNFDSSTIKVKILDLKWNVEDITQQICNDGILVLRNQKAQRW